MWSISERTLHQNHPESIPSRVMTRVSSLIFEFHFQPLKTNGAPIHCTRELKVSNQELEPVPLAEINKRPIGGISVKESRDLLQEADLVDRKVERERIRSKHKDQRRKVKKRRREEQVLDQFFLSLRRFSRSVHPTSFTVSYFCYRG